MACCVMSAWYTDSSYCSRPQPNARKLNRPGMRWGLERAERVLPLRCVLVIDMRDNFEQRLQG